MSDIYKELIGPGLSLILEENHNVPLAAIGIFFKGGLGEENSGNNGITKLTLRTLLKGTRSKTASEIFEKLEYLGATLNLEIEPDFYGFLLKVLPRNLSPIWEIIMEILSSPVFPKEEVEQEKRILLAELEKEKDSMAEYPFKLLKKALFLGHPYELTESGKKESVQNLSEKIVKEWYKKNFSRENLIISAVGDFKNQELKKILANGLEELNSNLKEKTSIKNISFFEEKREEVELREKSQTALALGARTCPYFSEDYYPLKVVQGVLSGMGGRFFVELREKRSLAYTVYGYNESWFQSGAFFSYIATSPANEKTALEGLFKELEKIKSELVEKEELERAKNSMIGNYALALETNSAKAFHYARNEILGRGFEGLKMYPEKLKQITSKQVQEVAQKYFNVDNFCLGAVRGKK
jgi:zinc protease